MPQYLYTVLISLAPTPGVKTTKARNTIKFYNFGSEWHLPVVLPEMKPLQSMVPNTWGNLGSHVTVFLFFKYRERGKRIKIVQNMTNITFKFLLNQTKQSCCHC